MAGFKFKPESILEFSCPGLGIDAEQPAAKTFFNSYISRVGIQPDAEGFYDTDDFQVNYCAVAANTLHLQYQDQYSNNDKGLYYGNRYQYISDYVPFLGYITLPFLSKGEKIRIPLPGTLITCKNKLFSQIGGFTGTITRTKDYLTITNDAGSVIVKKAASEFPNGVVPLFLFALCQGGGGGGSSQQGVVAGRGGAGGGFSAGTISFMNRSTFSITAGAGGTGGKGTGSDNADDPGHDGTYGRGSVVGWYDANLSFYGLEAGGGRGGEAESATRASGGSFNNTADFPAYTGSTVYYGCAGGYGAVDGAQPAGSVTRQIVGPIKNNSELTNTYVGANTTNAGGTTYTPGGGGGGASWYAKGGDAGSGANDAPAVSSTSYGAGGGGGGYLVLAYKAGAAGGPGIVELYY